MARNRKAFPASETSLRAVREPPLRGRSVSASPLNYNYGAHDGIRTRDSFKSPSTSLRSASGTPPACRCAPPSGLFYGAHDGIRTRDSFKSPSTSLRSASGTPPACRCAPPSGLFYGAHDGIRTRDLFLTKEVLYRLSYMGPETFSIIRGYLERETGLEPATPSLEGSRSTN